MGIKGGHLWTVLLGPAPRAESALNQCELGCCLIVIAVMAAVPNQASWVRRAEVTCEDVFGHHVDLYFHGVLGGVGDRSV